MIISGPRAGGSDGVSGCSGGEVQLAVEINELARQLAHQRGGLHDPARRCCPRRNTLINCALATIVPGGAMLLRQ
jgi:hypothetical protein